MPPLDDTINQELGIKTLNTLFSKGSWRSFAPIVTKFDGLEISAERVIRDPATNHNFHLKKLYFTNMVGCKFFEVLFNYHTSLSALSQTCRHIKLKSLLNYFKCVTKLFEAINGSMVMFNAMLTIINTLEVSSILDEITLHSCLSLFNKYMMNYITSLSVNEVIRDTFEYKPDVDVVELADEYLEQFKKSRHSFSVALRNYKSHKLDDICVDGLLLLDYYNFMDSMRIDPRITNRYMSDIIITDYNDYQLIYYYLQQYCNDFIKTNFVDTGFSKIC